MGHPPRWRLIAPAVGSVLSPCSQGTKVPGGCLSCLLTLTMTDVAGAVGWGPRCGPGRGAPRRGEGAGAHPPAPPVPGSGCPFWSAWGRACSEPQADSRYTGGGQRFIRRLEGQGVDTGQPSVAVLSAFSWPGRPFCVPPSPHSPKSYNFDDKKRATEVIVNLQNTRTVCPRFLPRRVGSQWGAGHSFLPTRSCLRPHAPSHRHASPDTCGPSGDTSLCI